MKNTFRFLTVLALCSAPVIHADESAKTWIQQGDALYLQRQEMANNVTALDHYKKAIAAEPSNIEAIWKASRAIWWIGTLQTKRDERLKTFKEGIAYGEAAVKLAPESADARFWLAGNISSYGNAKGAFTSLVQIKEIRKQLKEVNRINDRIMGGGGYRILGIIDYKLPSIMGGDKKRALEELEKALAIDPNNPVTIFYLADYYAAIGKKDKALDYLAQLRKLTPSPDFAAEMPLMLKQANELEPTLKS